MFAEGTNQMSLESVDEARTEELRQIEREKREQRRLARERGEIPALRARRRAANPSGPGVAVTTPDAAPAPLVLPARLVTILDRVGEEAGVADMFHDVLMRAGNLRDPMECVANVVRESISAAFPALVALAHLADLTTAGMAVFSDDESLRAEAILTDRLPAPPVAPAKADSWQLLLEAHEAGTRAVLSKEAWRRVVHTLPLAVVDDLIDSGKLDARADPASWPDRNDRSRYVTARVSPGALDASDVRALAWTSELRRRAVVEGAEVLPIDGRHDEWSLRAALLAGDVNALDKVGPLDETQFPSDLSRLVHSLQAVRRGAAVGPELGHEPGLFFLLEDCLPHDRLVSGSSKFHYWAGTRRLYRLLDEAHWFMAAEPDIAPDVLRGVVEQATALRNEKEGAAAGKADREARAVLAYVYFLTARPGDRDRLDRAVGLLEEVLMRGTRRRGGVDPKARRRMIWLSELLQALRQKSRPHDVLNPYLALSVEHGSSEWRHGWRNLRGQVPADQLEYINNAKDRIQRREMASRLGRDVEILYELPLDERFLWIPRAHSPVLQPQIRPMERRTEPSTSDERNWTASEAARDIISRSSNTRQDY
ncbi:hypothetical protein [Streptomyces sp. ISL-94]|uniref:hypothetical protein n=1 Tax=Streptomyces sp. ISL-94 TaxID=2819190 RepID=UPI001BE658C0|nr:hypothetical protein [Streptomyces sp. ISL-94]MBT2482471.1 hypothetical protein [Streptomyces sp. ISL-94]